MAPTLRDAHSGDAPFLWHCLEIITGLPGADLRAAPALAKYVTGWAGDAGVVAEGPDGPVGAAWVRTFSEADEPFFAPLAGTPELALAVLPEHRGGGLGAALLAALIERMGGRPLCLNVREENPARRLYARFGFHDIAESRKANRFGTHSVAMLRPDLAPLLRATDVMDFEHPAVAALAKELGAGRGAGAEPAVAAACFAWVRDRIPHTVDLGGGPVPCAASEVLEAGTGFCFAKSHLLAALLRANGFPAALCYQRLSIDDTGPPFTLHGMVAVLLPGHGWYRCDPRGDKPGIRTAFTPPVEALAYQPKLPGEGDVPGLHADPLPQVLRALRSAATCEELLANLPGV